MAKSNKGVSVADEVITSKIYLIREKKVMLDRDLASLYQVQPIRLREQVKRNQARFPRNFMFQLTEQEAENMVSQNAIPSKQHLGGYLPYAFTEHGVLMLANILRSETAIQTSIRIIEIFVKMREMLSVHKDVLLKLEQLENQVGSHDKDIQKIFKYLNQFLLPAEQVNRRMIGYATKDRE